MITPKARRSLLRWLILLPLNFGAAGVDSAQEFTVPTDHQVYPLLFKAEAMQLCDGYLLRVLPLTRGNVVHLLQQIATGESRLSAADRGLLAQMRLEFADPRIGEAGAPGGERHAYRYEEGSAQIFVDTRAIQVFRFSRRRLDGDDQSVSETTAEGRLRLRFGDRLFIGARAHNTMILGEKGVSENFDPGSGTIVSTSGGAVFADQAIGYAAATAGILHLRAGRNFAAWGIDSQEQLGLSLQNEPYDGLQFSLDFRAFRFTYLHAGLGGIAAKRYLAGHRIDLRPWDKLQFGIYETVVYGGRGLETGYLNPFVPYHVIEHHLGDRDNNTLGFDFNYYPAAGVKLSGELFIDDLSLDKSLGTYWGNKLAYLAVVRWAQPFALKTLQLAGSYTRVDPFVYTHFDSVDVYRHFGESVGARLGPNADRFHFGLEWRPLRDARWEVGYSFVRRGAGSLLVAHRREDGERKGFLAGTIERDHELQIRLRHQWQRDIFLGFEVLLRNRLDANRTSGVNRLERFARFFVDVNY